MINIEYRVNPILYLIYHHVLSKRKGEPSKTQTLLIKITYHLYASVENSDKYFLLIGESEVAEGGNSSYCMFYEILLSLSFERSISIISIDEFENRTPIFPNYIFKIKKCSIRSLKGIENFKLLSFTSLGNCKLDEDIELHLIDDKLKILDLRYNNISDLSKLKKLKSLKKLDLWNNQISDLTSLANLNSLTNLDLQNNQFSDPSPLTNLRSLKVLSLQNNPDLKKQQIEDLKNDLPNCNIYY